MIFVLYEDFAYSMKQPWFYLLLFLRRYVHLPQKQGCYSSLLFKWLDKGGIVLGKPLDL